MQREHLKANTNASCLHNHLVFYIIWSWRNYWIIIHTGAFQRPVTFSDWITSIHNLRTAARVLDHTCYVINLKKSFDSICMKRYKVWFILVFENFGRLLFPCPCTILPFLPFTPSYKYLRSVNDFSAVLDFEWNICTSFFIYKKDVGVESFHDEKFKFNFLNFSKSADVQSSIKKRAMTGILVQPRGC